MVTPQEMMKENMPPPDEREEPGSVYKFLTSLIAWTLFMGVLTLIGATILFIALALWRGIIWLWPAGGVAA